MCHIGTWSTRYCMRTAEKIWRSKVKKIRFAECQKKMTLGKSAICRVLGEDTRQRVNGGCQPLTAAALCRVLLFATRQTISLPSVSCLPSALSLALGKEVVCRVPSTR